MSVITALFLIQKLVVLHTIFKLFSNWYSSKCGLYNQHGISESYTQVLEYKHCFDHYFAIIRYYAHKVCLLVGKTISMG